MARKKKISRSRILSAIVIIGIGLSYKIHHVSKIESFTLAYNVGIFSLMTGFLILIGNKFTELDKKKPVSFFLYPKRWILNLFKSLAWMGFLVGIVLLISSISTQMSMDWLKYRVERNSKSAVCEVVGFKKEIEMGKYPVSYRKFAKIQFQAEKSSKKGFVMLDKDSKIRIGDKVEVKFNRDNPELVYFIE